MSREFTGRLLALINEGEVRPAHLARDLLAYMSEDEVKHFVISHGYLSKYEIADLPTEGQTGRQLRGHREQSHV